MEGCAECVGAGKVDLDVMDPTWLIATQQEYDPPNGPVNVPALAHRLISDTLLRHLATQVIC